MPLKITARIMRIFFRLLYHQLAWTYDFVAAAVSLGRWKEWVMTTLPYLGGPRLLELGFGPGHLQSALTARAVSAFGVDASPQMAGLARKRLVKAGLSYQLVNARAQRLPFPEGRFDQIAATFPPQFILSEDTLREAQRVLTAEGTLVVLPNAWITGERPLERAAAWVFEATGQAPPWNGRMLAYFTRAGFQAQVERVRRTSWTVNIILARKA